MKKKLMTLAALAVCLAVLGAGTLAYFTDEAKAHNVITSAGIDIEIAESQLTDGKEEPYPADPIPVMPGAQVSKIVRVENLEAKAWVRARAVITVRDAEGNVMDLTEEAKAAVFTLNYNTEAWTYRDGWYYCSEALSTGEASEPLFTTVEFSGPNMTNEYQNCTVEIDVEAQATQFANNGDSALTAAGWPAEATPDNEADNEAESDNGADNGADNEANPGSDSESPEESPAQA